MTMHPERPWLARFAKLTVAATFCLILLGGMVTSLGAGLAVPDWPTSYGYNMFSFPVARWIGPVFWEHTHRLVASLIGLMTMILAFWTSRVEPRAWVRWLAFGALGLVIVQGVLGGLRVTHRLIALAMIHGCTAQAFLCVLMLLALALSPAWQRPFGGEVDRVRAWMPWAWALAAAVYVQLIVGAVMRHLGAGLAIPTFPFTPEGRLIPSERNLMVDIHLAHRIWAVAVVALAGVVLAKMARSVWDEPRLAHPAFALAGLLLAQVFLGASVIWLTRAPIPTSLHVVNGAAVLATSFVLAVRGSRFLAEPARTVPNNLNFQ